MTIESKLLRFMHEKLKQAIEKGRVDKAGIIATAIKTLFPDQKEIVIYDTIFDISWEHYYAGQRGDIKKVLTGYNYLVNKYYAAGILSLPRGAIELLNLGRWSFDRNPQKAVRYLRAYLNAKGDQCSARDCAKYRKEAMTLLEKLNV